MKRFGALAVAVSFVAISLASGKASTAKAAASAPLAVSSATPFPTPKPPTPFQAKFVYSVKFVCGNQGDSPILGLPAEMAVRPGAYATSINIQNLSPTTQPFCKQAVIAYDELASNGHGMPVRGPISTLFNDNLGTLEALEDNCSDIFTLYSNTAAVPLPGFIEGFVLIASPVPLSVTAVYTSSTCTFDAQGDCDPPIALEGPQVVPQSPVSEAFKCDGIAPPYPIF